MSHLKLLDYKITAITFKLADMPPGERNFRISPRIKMDIRQGDKNYFLAITVTVDKNQATPSPFEIEVTLGSNFIVLEKGDIETLRREAATAVFPYLRSAIANITVAANMPAYFLPLIDFSAPAKEENKGGGVTIRPLEEEI